MFHLNEDQDEDGTNMNAGNCATRRNSSISRGPGNTTANTIRALGGFMAQIPPVEKKFHEELDGVLGGRAPGRRLPKLTYLSQVRRNR